MNKLDLFKRMVLVSDGEVITTSKIIADVFGKQHYNVIRDIKGLDCDDEFAKLNFEVCFENNDLQNGKAQPYYNITKDGATYLIMGYRGKRAAEFKQAYIRAFNWMSDNLKSRDELSRKINDFTKREAISVSNGSLHGRGLAQRRREKAKLAVELKELQEKAQMSLPDLQVMSDKLHPVRGINAVH